MSIGKIQSAVTHGSSKLAIQWDDGTRDELDLAPIIAANSVLAPLGDPEVFHGIQAADDGWSLEWPACGIDFGAPQLRRWADEQAGRAMSPQAFRAWVERNGLTLDGAAEALGLSRRTIAYYLSGEQPVPKTVMLATERFRRHEGADLTSVVRFESNFRSDGISIGPFAVTKSMIAGLGDEPLRELLGKLLEAEAFAYGIPSSAIELGGNQTAPDAGIDARFAWTGPPEPAGRLPRRTIIFQCKATQMRKAAIEREMRFGGCPRSIFADLAAAGGAYILFSTDDPGAKALETRRIAMLAALVDVPNAERIHLDFLGADAIARWTNRHIGVALWLLAEIGRPLVGWRAFGSWSGEDAAEQSYLFDGSARASVDGAEQNVRAAMASARATLRLPGSAVRLVGMSGMGKTRLAEALFDHRVPAGTALDPALAIYADAGLELAVGVAVMAEQLVLARIDAVLVVDNCTASAHRQLSQIVRRPNSRVRLLTIDYDVGDEQPEDTLVVRLSRNSDELLGDILAQRFPRLGEHARHTLTRFSDGNARIALGIARNCGPDLDLTKLNDSELLDRLFQRGRGEHDTKIRCAAEIASLVWAFYVEDSRDHSAEHTTLAEQADVRPESFYEQVSQLLDWGIVQQRGPQRAVMPPPLANLLAGSALRRVDRKALVARFAAGPSRLFESLARRIGQLHDHPSAAKLAADLLDPTGLLGDLSTLDTPGRRAFVAIAPAAPDAALAAVERAHTSERFPVDEDFAVSIATMLAHIAWEPALFAKAMMAMLPLTLEPSRLRTGDRIRKLFLERFRPGLSMTMADGPTRLDLIDALLGDDRVVTRKLAIAALDHMLETQFSSSFDTEWGSRNRTREWRPRLPKDEMAWFGAAYARLAKVAATHPNEAEEARRIVASHLRSHCDLGLASLALEAVRLVRPQGYWDRGWRECCEALHFGHAEPEPDWRSALAKLELSLRPQTVEDLFAAFVLGEPWRHWHPNSRGQRYTRDASLLARAVGVYLARSGNSCRSYIARAVAAEGTNSAIAFGRGLASASADLDALWSAARAEFSCTNSNSANPGALIGILQGGDRRDREWGDARLDEVAGDPLLSGWLVHFHGGRVLGASDMTRLVGALESSLMTPAQLGALMYGGRTKSIPSPALADLLARMAAREDGLLPALEILHMRLYSDRQAKQDLAPELSAVGRSLLTNPRLYRHDGDRVGHEAGSLAAYLLKGDDGAIVAAAICRAMRQGVRQSSYWSESHWGDLANALMKVFPRQVLDEVVQTDVSDRPGSLLALFFGGSLANDIDGSARRKPFNGEDVLAWIAEAPEERAGLIAHVAPYTTEEKDTSNLGWNDFALSLIELAPEPVVVLDIFERRFYSGVGTGPFWLRFERRQPMIKKLSEHHDVRVRQWAAGASERLVREIEYWQARDWEEESLFE